MQGQVGQWGSPRCQDHVSLPSLCRESSPVGHTGAYLDDGAGPGGGGGGRRQEPGLEAAAFLPQIWAWASAQVDRVLQAWLLVWGVDGPCRFSLQKGRNGSDLCLSLASFPSVSGLLSRVSAVAKLGPLGCSRHEPCGLRPLLVPALPLLHHCGPPRQGLSLHIFRTREGGSRSRAGPSPGPPHAV